LTGGGCRNYFFDKEKYGFNKYRKKGWMPKRHPIKDYVQSICKLSTRSATLKANPSIPKIVLKNKIF